MIKMDDRVTQGFISGIGGALPEMIFTLTLYGLHLIRFRYMDFAAILAFNHRPKGLFQSIIAEVIVWLFLGLLGAVFSLTTKHIASDNLVLKSALFGTYSWFFIYGIVTLYKVYPFYPILFPTSFAHLIGGLIWGFSMGWLYSLFNKKFGLKN